jgi:hypothetical protein
MPDGRGLPSGPVLYWLSAVGRPHPNSQPRWALPMGGLLEAHFGQEEGTEADLESEARLGRTLDHFQA